LRVFCFSFFQRFIAVTLTAMFDATDQPNYGLYCPEFEHDACGIGFRAHLKGRRSHKIVSDAITMLERMDHRGACGCDPNTGDGAGILLQIPHEFFIEQCSLLGFALPPGGEYGVGMVYFPKDALVREECKEILERKAKKLGLEIIGYRVVPVENADLGTDSAANEPQMEQLFIRRPSTISDEMAFERKLYVFRQLSSRIVNETVKGVSNKFYFASLSCRTIIYKGMLTTMQVTPYFPDLSDEAVTSAFAIVHSRFSTNTFPEWKLAQPFRFIAHNGEINTVKGNVSWMNAQSALFESTQFSKEELEQILPICAPGQSDSAMLDNAIELLYLAGRSLPHVMMMLIPEAWDGNEHMDSQRRAFYEYHAALMEPWDGPASISFTDGKIIGATLDRNGLRPSRFWVLEDDTVIMASEAGVLDVEQSKVVSKGRLQPGKMFIVDMEQGRIIPDEELKAQICNEKPYGEWLKKYKIKLEDLPDPLGEWKHPYEQALLTRQQVFGFTSEDVRMILKQMIESGKEAIGSMGIDTPLAILSHQSQHLSYYFKQLFAQVTNPPIDSIRERSIMSLISYVGGFQNLLSETPEHCKVLELKQPVLSNKELEKIRHIDTKDFTTKTIHVTFRANGGADALQKAIERICRYCEDAVNDDYQILLLSDRGVDSNHAPIPSLLATSAVHQHLIRKGLRAKVGLIVEAGDVWETHHFATLIGFGASAVNPYMAFETITSMFEKKQIEVPYPVSKLYQNYIKAVNGELLKIFSKMGISTLQSYQGAQIFEAVGLNKKVIEHYFTGTVSRIGGLNLEGIQKEVLIKHRLGFGELASPIARLEVGGVYQWKQRGEMHLFNPNTIHALQQSTKTGNYETFRKYTRAIDDQVEKSITLRSLLRFKKSKAIPLEEVESIEAIMTRFATGAMSFGSISYEAHSTLAVAMNRIGGKSNTGEGGEDPIRFQPLPNGDSLNSAIKQVASGRFGVTMEYLTNARELQIKMAQGAKPGEGGQLPGHKVDDWIGKTRHSTPGVGLISPPPHHDIYSIEDLAQLIFDLKNANREARISVKLVSEAGVGTVAAGVAKAHADHILIAGHDGGTGASPLSSIRHAGLPWELGLAETHQTLVRNKLRGRVTIQADGQIKTGRDIVIATLLGAEEWGVATAALVTMGCIMMRKCHLNTCPVGVATQNPELRALFTGDADHVVNLFRFLATEVREYMAELGFRTINEMVGQVDRLEFRDDITHWKYKQLDLSAILYKEPISLDVALYKQEEQDHGLDQQIDWRLIEAAAPALYKQEKATGSFSVINVNRSIGTMLSNEVTKRYGGKGLPNDTIHFKFQGTAGQSFGAFTCNGMTLELEGDANDYVGKGLCGGEIIVYPDRKAKFEPSQNSIVGNVTFYGATSGEAYLRGMAGERFCVRNSGAKVVVEGIGDHGCEYMTGGLTIILGQTGRNFAAGMSGGVAYVWDLNGDFRSKVNGEMVAIENLNTEDLNILRMYVENHLEKTQSDVARQILEHWESLSAQFLKVLPTDFKTALSKRGLTLTDQLADKSIVYQNIQVAVKI
jgi:glutamate synthase (NADPH) large chain